MELCLPLVSFYHWAHKMYLCFSKERFSRDYIRPYLSLSLFALCDTLLIALAVIGVSVVVFTIPVLQIGLYIIGFCFLVYMGWSVWNTSSSTDAKEKQEFMPARKQILFACSVSLLNPHAILDTIGVIGTNSLQYSGAEKLAFTLACIIVSWLWFIGLAFLGKMLGKLDTNGEWMNRINKASAVMIWLVALYIAYQLIV